MNVFWPAYKSLESEFLKITYYVHIDDKQLKVYSSKISDLLLRTVVEIESISKILYSRNAGTKTDHIRYDDDVIKLLNQKWLIDKKTVLITSHNLFISNTEIYPFEKNTQKTGKGTMTYSWNNAYQNIKHDRAEYLHEANIKNLIEGMAALFLLNLYYSDLTYNLEKDANANSLSPNMGSEIFSILIHPAQYDREGNYSREKDFDKCTYNIQYTEKTGKIFLESMKEYVKKVNETISKHPKIIEFMKNPDVAKLNGNWQWNILGQEEYINVVSQVTKNTNIKSDQLRYEAVINKNKI